MNRLRFLAAAAALLLAGCATSQAEREEPLPFHVALIPVTTVRVEPPPPPPPPPPDPDAAPRNPPPPPLQIEVGSELATASCQRALEERCFVRVTPLAFPDGMTAGQFDASRTPEQRDAWWIAQARAAGADLLLRCEMRYDAIVPTSTNRLFVPNLLLFAIGGPFCYFLDDRNYDVRAEFDAKFWDVSAAGGARLEPRAALLDPRFRSRPCTLDFIDRTWDESKLFYVVSLIIPAGLLCQRSGQVKSEVTEALVGQLCDDLAGEIARRSLDLEEPHARTPLSLDGESPFRATRRDDGQVDVDGLLQLRPGGGRDRLHAWSVRAGGAAQVARAPEPTDDGGVLRYRLRATLAAPPDERFLQLTVADASRERNERTFTVPIE